MYGGGALLGGQDGGALGTAVPAAINKALATHFPAPNTRVIGEPGRYMVQDAATIAYAINGVRPRHALVRAHSVPVANSTMSHSRTV